MAGGASDWVKEAGEPREGRQPSLADAALAVGTLIAFLALSYYLFGDRASSGPNQVALLFCAIIAAGNTPPRVL